VERDRGQRSHRPPHEPGDHLAPFAILNLTFADSVIAFYDAKYHYASGDPSLHSVGHTIGNMAITGDDKLDTTRHHSSHPSYPRPQRDREAGAQCCRRFSVDKGWSR